MGTAYLKIILINIIVLQLYKRGERVNRGAECGENINKSMGDKHNIKNHLRNFFGTKILKKPQYFTIIFVHVYEYNYSCKMIN